MARSSSKRLEHRQHAYGLVEDENVGVSHYLDNVPTNSNKQGMRSPCKDYSRMTCTRVADEIF